MAKNGQRPRLRELGIEVGTLTAGPLNAITDVPGVRVGHISLMAGRGELVVGEGPVRTGVTAVLPHGGNLYRDPVRAGAHVINGFGKTVGLPQLIELGELESPILLTGTLNVWTAADALLDYMLDKNPDLTTFNPVVGECNDSHLNDACGRHVKKEHVFEALNGAAPDNTEEGCIGAGVGMRGFGWKAGIGTSSRLIDPDHVLGVMVLMNTGRPDALRILGVPVGQMVVPRQHVESEGSIMIIVATDCPLSSRQVTRVARRASLGLARTGAEATHGSGDFVIAFSTDRSGAGKGEAGGAVYPERNLDRLFRAVIEATEEAVLNSLFRAETTEGRDGHRVEALPVGEIAGKIKDVDFLKGP